MGGGHLWEAAILETDHIEAHHVERATQVDAIRADAVDLLAS